MLLLLVISTVCVGGDTYLFYVDKCFDCTYVCALCVCLVPEEARRGRALELQLEIVLSYHVGTESRVLWKSNQCS